MMPKMNRIIAKGVKGIYKDENIKIIIGEDATKSKIFVEDKEIKNVFGVHIHIRVGQLTKVVIEKHTREVA